MLVVVVPPGLLPGVVDGLPFLPTVAGTGTGSGGGTLSRRLLTRTMLNDKTVYICKTNLEKDSIGLSTPKRTGSAASSCFLVDYIVSRVQKREERTLCLLADAIDARTKIVASELLRGGNVWPFPKRLGADSTLLLSSLCFVRIPLVEEIVDVLTAGRVLRTFIGRMTTQRTGRSHGDVVA